MHVQVLITFSLVSHWEQKISRYTYFELRASFAFSKRPLVSSASGMRVNNKFPPLENIRTSKCPIYSRGGGGGAGGCYTIVLIGALEPIRFNYLRLK